MSIALVAIPKWIDPAWEPLPFDIWPQDIVRLLRRNGVETWNQLEKLSAAQVMLWNGAGRQRLTRLQGLLLDAGRWLRLTREQAQAIAEPLLMPVCIPPPDEKPRPNVCGIYFVQSGAFIKIGIAYDVRQRFKALFNGNPHELRPLGFLPRPYDEAQRGERELHRMFSAYRYRLEWFHECLFLVQFIAQEAEPWPKANHAP